MKTLNSTLYELSKRKDISVKIGSKYGVGFWFCGKLTPTTIRDVDKEYDRQKAKELRLITKNQNIYENLDEHYDKIISNWINHKKNKNKPQEKKDEYVRKTLKTKENVRISLPKYLKKLEYDTTHSFLNREVVEMLDGISPDEPNTKVIYIKGYERGEYYSLKQYIKLHLPKEQQKTFNERLPKLSEGENWE